ncbi:MAG: hypothetical protein H0W67_01160 [Gemmatimonadales bacterium]|nr:hypothetical protein [Gemmatimonadales bacterium]
MPALRSLSFALLTSFFLAVPGTSLPAQTRLAQPFARYVPSPGRNGVDSLPSHPIAGPKDPVTLALGGILVGGAGMVAGAAIGAQLREDHCEDCGLAGLIYGGILGELATVPLGVHLANRRQGSYSLGLLSSLAVTGAGLAIAAGADRTEVLLAVPVLQIITAVAVERATSR